MTRRQIGDFTAEVHDEGAGPPVVLVHGSASDARTWKAQIGPLGDRFRVITYSRRFHWPNERETDETNYSMSQHVDDLVRLVESLDAGPVHLVGHSYGGFIALLTSLRHPDIVRSQVLIEPPVVPLFLSDPPKPGELFRVLLRNPTLGIPLLKFGAKGLVPAKKAAAANDMEEAIRVFGKAVLGQKTVDQLSPARWEQIEANNIRAEYLSEIFDPLTAADVRSITTPSLLVTGTDSPRVWAKLTGHLHELLPNSQMVEVPRASHIVHEDNSPAFNEHLLDFLAAQPSV